LGRDSSVLVPRRSKWVAILSYIELLSERSETDKYISPDYKNRVELTSGFCRCFMRFEVMDKKISKYRWDTLWIALIPLMGLNGTGTRVIEKRANGCLLDPSLKKSQGDNSTPPKRLQGHEKGLPSVESVLVAPATTPTTK